MSRRMIGMAGCSCRDRFSLMAAFRSMTEEQKTGVQELQEFRRFGCGGAFWLPDGQGKSGADTYLGVLAGCARFFLVVKSSISSDVLL